MRGPLGCACFQNHFPSPKAAPQRMKINKTALMLSAAFFVVFAECGWVDGGVAAFDNGGERILYDVTPVGKAEYRDFGLVDLEGAKMNLVTLRTKVLLVDDLEKIYSDPESSLPYKVERNVSGFWGKEYITEEYNQEKGFVKIRKFKNSRQVSERTIRRGGPMHSAILLPFYLRKRPRLSVGLQLNATVIPNEFKINLVSIDEITVPAGKFQAYHFKSRPDKFEVWINKDDPRVPLKIQFKGAFPYVLSMEEYGS